MVINATYKLNQEQIHDNVPTDPNSPNATITHSPAPLSRSSGYWWKSKRANAHIFCSGFLYEPGDSVVSEFSWHQRARKERALSAGPCCRTPEGATWGLEDWPVFRGFCKRGRCFLTRVKVMSGQI